MAEELEGLCARAVRVRRGRRLVLGGVDLSARGGEITAVLGPNGAGKSTLLRAIVGLLAYEGRVTLGGRDLCAIEARERAKILAYVPQQSLLDAPFEVSTVVAQGRYAHTRGLGQPSPADLEAVASAMARTDVTHLASRRFDRLSTGERRRVLLARALATEARTLLLDEPTASLDVRHALELHALLRELAEDGFCIVVVLHALEDARRHTDRSLLLADGAVVAEGRSKDVIDAPRVREVYGVELVEGGAIGFFIPEGPA